MCLGALWIYKPLFLRSFSHSCLVMEPEIEFWQLTLIGFMLVFCSISNVVIVFHIGKKNWKDLQPIHCHQINYFMNIFLVSLFGLLVLPGDKLSVRGFCPVILGSYFLSIDNVYSIFILQCDRYIAVRFPYLYKSKVDVSVTIKTIIAAKIFSLLNVLISTIIDPVFLLCPLCSRCIYVHSVNIYTVS